MSFFKSLFLSAGLCAFAAQGNAQDFTSDPVMLGFDTASLKTVKTHQNITVKRASFICVDSATQKQLFVSIEQNFADTVHMATMIMAMRKDFGYSISAYKDNAKDSLYHLVESVEPVQKKSQEGGVRYLRLQERLVPKDTADKQVMDMLNNYKNNPAATVEVLKNRSREAAKQQRKAEAVRYDN